jgi:hypothetical protein
MVVLVEGRLSVDTCEVIQPVSPGSQMPAIYSIIGYLPIHKLVASKYSPAQHAKAENNHFIKQSEHQGAEWSPDSGVQT